MRIYRLILRRFSSPYMPFERQVMGGLLRGWPELLPGPASLTPMNSRSILALLGALVLLGCATPSAQQSYLRALEDARFPLPSEVAEDLVVLKQGEAKLRWDGKGRVLVTTWTKQAYYKAPEYKQGYSFALYGEAWFTAADQVRMLCSESQLRGAALRLRLEQLLGLPQGGSSDSFLQVWIDPAALFRPCAEPSVTKTS